MIKYTNADKTLVVPSGLGNFGQGSGSGGGVTPQQAAEIASAVTEAAIYEYDTEIQVDLEELRDAISASTGTLLDLAEIAAMTVAERVELFDEIYEKVSNGEKAYIKGLVQEEAIRTAILPIVSYRPESNPVLHQGGNLYFAAKGDTDNVYFHFNLYSDGSVDPVSGQLIKRNIYNLPTASAEVKGGVRIGSGLTMTQDTLSVDTTGLVTDGDLAPFIVQQSANTENIASLSAATGAISESLANYATTATTDALSAVTSALTENVETVSGKVGEVYDAIFYEDEGETHSQIDDLWDALDEKQDLEAGSGISINDNVVSINPPGRAISLSGTGRLQLNLGSGVTIGEDNELNLKIGEGLAFSGNTLVVSGGTGGGPAVYIVNLLTEQERIALYNELMAYRYADSYIGVQSGFPVSDYAFYYWAGDDTSDEFNGDFRGFVPLQLAALHPDDYGGAAFFSGMVLSRNGGGLIRTIKYVIASDGSVDMTRGTNNWDPHPEASYIYVDSDGTFRNDLWSLGNITNGDIIYRLNIRYDNNGNYSLGPVTEYRKNYEEVETDVWRDVYYFSTVISINGTTYKGTWRLVDSGDWEGQGPYPATSWTTV